MVHYIRFLRTPQVSDVSRKSLEVSAVVAVTTDLGDAFLSQDLVLIARIVDATQNGEILCSAEFSWKVSSRAAKISVPCGSKVNGRLVCLQVTTRDTISAYASCEIPAVVDIWSTAFHIKPRAKSEALVERRLQLTGRSTARIWEETGDSIARHIWDASLGCLIYLNSCFNGSDDDSLPLLRKLLTADKSKRLRILEVGAGCGIVGIALSHLRKCEVVLTDLEDAQEIMQSNVDCATPASGSSLKRQVLGWGSGLDDLESGKFDMVLVSDCIYNPDSSVLLVETIKALTEQNPNVLVFVAFKRRHDADDIFFNHMQENELRVVDTSIIKLPHIMTDHDSDEPQIETFVYTYGAKQQRNDDSSIPTA